MTASERGARKVRDGVVVSDKMQKTIVVQVERTVQHGQYKKQIRLRRRFKAHDEKNECKTGDRVRIEETRPLSRDKRWRLKTILERAKV
ncbi:MAG: small subunit ribosomal protein [Candidatus Binatota bacterium]|nr:small subunit ribosomal protein [Candidatus Binatota bacterium]